MPKTDEDRSANALIGISITPGFLVGQEIIVKINMNGHTKCHMYSTYNLEWVSAYLVVS